MMWKAYAKLCYKYLLILMFAIDWLGKGGYVPYIYLASVPTEWEAKQCKIHYKGNSKIQRINDVQSLFCYKYLLILMFAIDWLGKGSSRVPYIYLTPFMISGAVKQYNINPKGNYTMHKSMLWTARA